MEKILFKVKEKRIPTHALLSQGSLLGIRGYPLHRDTKRNISFIRREWKAWLTGKYYKWQSKRILGQDLQITFIFMEDEQYNDIVVKRP